MRQPPKQTCRPDSCQPRLEDRPLYRRRLDWSECLRPGSLALRADGCAVNDGSRERFHRAAQTVGGTGSREDRLHSFESNGQCIA
jgi:hypothetical protein